MSGQTKGSVGEVSWKALAPFQDLLTERERIPRPRPLAWALLGRPFGAPLGSPSGTYPSVRQKKMGSAQVLPVLTRVSSATPRALTGRADKLFCFHQHRWTLQNVNFFVLCFHIHPWTLRIFCTARVVNLAIEECQNQRIPARFRASLVFINISG